MKQLDRAYFAYWGKRGGNQRKKNLTPERRIEIARKAGLAASEARKKKNDPVCR